MRGRDGVRGASSVYVLAGSSPSGVSKQMMVSTAECIVVLKKRNALVVQTAVLSPPICRSRLIQCHLQFLSLYFLVLAMPVALVGCT
jgi:hypothetical protein